MATLVLYASAIPWWKRQAARSGFASSPNILKYWWNLVPISEKSSILGIEETISRTDSLAI